MNGLGIPFLVAADLRKSYRQGNNEAPVLRGIDISLSQGQSLALLGVSGIGKSTLLNILGGIETADSGLLRVGDITLDRSPRTLAEHRRHNVGFIFQFYNLLPALTVLENVLAGLDALGPLPADAIARAKESLSVVGMVERADAFPSELSGGQQQRVAIARALVKRAPLVLADEPTGNLDPQTGEQVLRVLLDQCAEVGSALVIVTHNQRIAEQTGLAVTLAEGRLHAWKTA